jgi:hypothetical protein
MRFFICNGIPELCQTPNPTCCQLSTRGRQREGLFAIASVGAFFDIKEFEGLEVF